MSRNTTPSHPLPSLHPHSSSCRWVLGGVDLNPKAAANGLSFSLSRRASVSSVVGKRADHNHASPASVLVDSKTQKGSAVFEGVLHKTGKGIVGKGFFHPRRVRITNGMLM